MLKRVDKLLIGKDISRDAQVVAGAGIATITLDTGCADGEVVVLDKQKRVLAAGATIADSDTLFICQAMAETFDYQPESGSAITGARKLIFSDAIEGAKVRAFTARSYTAKAESTGVLTIAGMTPVVGTEYLIRVVYKDIKEHPGQFTQTFRHVAESVTLDTFGAAFAAKINSYGGRRVQASYSTGSDTITLTGRAIPECTTKLTDIDKFSMVEFTAYAYQINVTTGAREVIGSGITASDVVITGPVYGSGNWEQLRDLEKAQFEHTGVSNKTHFPVLSPDATTVKAETYDLIVIESDKSYLAPNNQGVEQAPLTTVIAIPYTATTNQMDSILAALNPWMASLPGAFANVSVD